MASRTIPGLDVQVTDAGGSFWQVTAHNTSSSPAKLLWDDSSYVSTTGSPCRLVRGHTRVIHSGQAQPGSPLPPGSTLKEVFIGEDYINNPTVIGKTVGDKTKSAKLYLVFDVNGSRYTHESTITFVDSSAAISTERR